MTPAFPLYNKELIYVHAIWLAGVSHMKHSNLYFQTQTNDCSKPQWRSAQRQVSGARCNWLLSFSDALEGAVTSQPIGTAAMAVTVQGEAWRKDSLACETYGAQMGLLNHQVAAPTVKYVRVLRFWCMGQKFFLLVESCCLWFAGNHKVEAKRKQAGGSLLIWKPYWHPNTFYPVIGALAHRGQAL